jgi:hypothetical protein
MINKRKSLSFCIFILPWLTAPFIGKRNFSRFLPSATFIGFLFTLFSEYADKKKYWKVKNALFPGYVLDYSFLGGLFFITTIWILKLTYGNFLKYLITNIIADYFFSFYVVKFFTKVGVFEFKKMRPKHFWGISVLNSIAIYIFQKVVEHAIVNESNESNESVRYRQKTN